MNFSFIINYDSNFHAHISIQFIECLKFLYYSFRSFCILLIRMHDVQYTLNTYCAVRSTRIFQQKFFLNYNLSISYFLSVTYESSTCKYTAVHMRVRRDEVNTFFYTVLYCIFSVNTKGALFALVSINNYANQVTMLRGIEYRYYCTDTWSACKTKET